MLGSYQCTNDPKETKQWVFNVRTNENQDLSTYDLDELSRNLSTYLKDKTKVLCFSKDRNELSGDHTKDIYKRGFCKPRMWAQYAENHTGMCLVFDSSALSKAINKKVATQFVAVKDSVKYMDRFLVDKLEDNTYTINIDFLARYGMEAYARVHFKEFNKRLFFEKLLDWSHEDEFRWIVASDSSEPIFLDIGSSLIGIVFGENTSDDVIERAMELTGYSLEYTGLKWRNCAPWYDLGNHKYIQNSPWRRVKEADKNNK